MIAFDVHLHESIGSTNDEARLLSEKGAPSGTVVCADQQTAGRGRFGRRWFSPPGNLYLSVLLRPAVTMARSAELGFVTALAVADTVDALLPRQARCSLKWPNDVLVQGAKVAGILLEQLDDAVVIGIGLNILHAPPDAAYQATTLASCGGLATVDVARTRLLNRLAEMVATWEADGFAPIRSAWLARAHPIGTQLRVREHDGTFTGRFAGLDEDGALLLDTAGGRRRITTGDVTD